MSSDLILLLGTAATLGVAHTLLGPDHYVPFVAMSRALDWSRAKTAAVALLCGVAHVLSSAVLGLLGILLGLMVGRLEALETFRGELAGWFLIAFGLVYFVWGLRRAYRHRPHSHLHVHDDGTVHAHTHVHEESHVHVHAPAKSHSSAARVTPWVLFTIFVFGPCEPLIPLLMYPAAEQSWLGVALVTLVFGAATLATMLLAVLALSTGLARLSFGKLERYTHALAGATVLFCGLAVQFLGL